MSELKKAPWKDKEGNEIFESSIIVHPSGETGRVFFDVSKENPDDAWLVKYTNDTVPSRLCLQIGDKGEATVTELKPADIENMVLDIKKGSQLQKVDKFNKDLVNQENIQTQPIDNSPLAVMMNALNNGMSLEKVEKMMDLQERYEKREAEKEYNSAMAEFKKTPVEIKKDKTNAQYNSKYSSIGATVNPCLPGMGECGLSHKWEFEPQTDKGIITGRCIVTHKGGHSESVDMSCPVDQSGKKNAIQQIKSTRTYIKIETFTSIMGLTSSEDVDDDGNGAGPQVEYISETQVADLTAKIEEKEVDQQKFLSFFKVDKLEDLLLQDFKRAIMMLEKKQ